MRGDRLMCGGAGRERNHRVMLALLRPCQAANQKGTTMATHWSREDLPHLDSIRDADDMAGNGMRSRVIDIALDEVVDHLNERHPKSDLRKVEAQRDTQKTNARRARRARDKWKVAAEVATSNATMWMDEAASQRALADAHRETADAWKSRTEAAERERDAARNDDRLHAWGRITRHPFFANRYMPQGALTESMLAALDEAIEATTVAADIDEDRSRAEKAEDLTFKILEVLFDYESPESATPSEMSAAARMARRILDN